MKEFFKFTLATIVGIILSSVVMLLVGIMIIVGVVSASESETQVKDNSILFLDLNGELLERTEDNPLKQFVGESFASYGLDDVLASIEKAKNNDKIKGIYIQTTSLGSSFASIEEIRNALLDFKKSGKFIVAYGDVYSQELYYLASVADKIMLNPQGSVDWKGLASQPIFYKDILNKLGVEMQVFKVGTYKSAVEPFIATEMSPANREQVTAFMGSIWNKLLNDVSASRKITIDSLNSYADKKLFFYPAEESVKCGLADTLVYKDGVRSYLKKLVKVDEDDDLNLLSLEDMINI
ncbi:MAG: S49 family peptidase, partial [Bacteroidaceae bacterium]